MTYRKLLRLRLPLTSVQPGFLILLVGLGLARPAPAAPPAEREKKLVIVAAKAANDVLKPFVKHKQQLLPTELVFLEDVLKSSKGADDAEKLKRFLYEKWKTDDLGYVLLVGDAEVMPVRYVAGNGVGPEQGGWVFMPSDLYYADLAKQDGSFEDWNARKDGFHAGYYAELMGFDGKDPINADKIHNRPEIAVGRWPVHTQAQIQTIVAKTIKYENHVLADDLPAARRAVFVNGPDLVDVRGSMVTWSDHFKKATGGKTVKLLYKDAARNDKTHPPSAAELEKALNGGAGMVFHVGHGSETSWEGCLDLSRLGEIKNAELPPVMFSAGCTSARFTPVPPGEPYVDTHGKKHRGSDAGERFDRPAPPPNNYQKAGFDRTSLGVEFLRAGPNGATAYIGCAVGSQDCAWMLMDGFVGYYTTHPSPRLGDAWVAGLRYYHRVNDLENIKPNDWYRVAIYCQGMKFYLFGDPSMRLPSERSSKDKKEVAKADDKGKGSKTADDKDLLQGEWAVTKMVIQGTVIGADDLTKLNLTVDGASWAKGLPGGKALKFAYKVDDAKSPKEIDLSGSGATWPAIYKLDGDALIVCESMTAAGKGGKRPTELKAGNAVWLTVYERQPK